MSTAKCCDHPEKDPVVLPKSKPRLDSAENAAFAVPWKLSIF
jgi:hypothetical protein